MIGSIIETSDLLRITGYERPADAAKCLRAQGIHVFYGKDGIWTTTECIMGAAGLRRAANSDPYSPDDV